MVLDTVFPRLSTKPARRIGTGTTIAAFRAGRKTESGAALQGPPGIRPDDPGVTCAALTCHGSHLDLPHTARRIISYDHRWPPVAVMERATEE